MLASMVEVKLLYIFKGAQAESECVYCSLGHEGLERKEQSRMRKSCRGECKANQISWRTFGQQSSVIFEEGQGGRRSCIS